MQFEYQPLKLGALRTRTATSADRSYKIISGAPRHETWREGLSGPRSDYEPHTEAQVLNRLRQATRQHHPKLWMVLGEPGAGKSRLLEEWFQRWASDLEEARLGLSIPVLVRLRSLTAEDTRLNPESLAERLWAQGVEERSRLDKSVAAVYQAETGQLFQPVWLLDGLDEVPPGVWGPDLPRKLAALPGIKVVTCRTAVFQALRENTAAYQENEHEILGLTPTQQQAFLSKFLDDAERATRLMKQIQGNVQLASLAGNPLMLGLIAEIQGEGALPDTRAEFYRKSAARLWHRRLTDQANLEMLRSQRDSVMIELASKMGLETIEAPLDLLDEAIRTKSANPAIAIALQQSGLLAINQDRETVAFIHLTFQEFYLAYSLKSVELRSVLERCWSNVRYEETLGLLISLLAAEQRYSEIADGLMWLVKWGRQIHQVNSKQLWELRRSPLRVALHVMRRAGIGLDTLGKMSSQLVKEATQFDLIRLAIAYDNGMPAEVLSALARDADQEVRQAVAMNTATSPVGLAALASDPDKWVRWMVAGNAATPPEALAALASDPDEWVHQRAARNPATPSEVLAALDNDQDQELPPEVVAALASDPDQDRPLEALAALACYPNEAVRWTVAQNAATPPEALAALARDPNEAVRHAVAGNAATPPEALAALAIDPDEWVRQAVPPEVLAALACYPNETVRWTVAGNAATPPEALAALAHDPDRRVRHAVAGNAATPPEALAIIARDPDQEMRHAVAGNAATPPEALAIIARDPDQEMRHAVAGNAATPPEALAVLARDPDQEMRKAIVKNAATPPEALAVLARDPDQEMRWTVAENAATPPEALAALAHDPNRIVRRAVARNAGTILEDFTSGGWMFMRIIRSWVARYRAIVGRL
jgi:hypothetical protein